MALRPPFPNDARGYGFEHIRYMAETLLNSEGVVNYATDLVVTPAASLLRVDVAAGAAWIKGDSGTPGVGLSQGLFLAINDAAVANAVTLSAADPTNPRLDQIYVQVRDSTDLTPGGGNDDLIFGVVTGTPTSGATLLNRNGAAALGNDRLLLADVLVPNGATNLTAANIRDRRIPANGRATRAVPGVETTTSTSYVELATPDQVHVYVPQDCPVLVSYSALSKIAAAANSYAALFITDVSTMTANQLKKADSTSAAPQVQEIGGATNTVYNWINTISTGLASAGGPGSDASEVTTGMSGGSSTAGPLEVRGLPAGIYSFSVRYKVASSTMSVKNRRLAVSVLGQGRSA